MPGTEPVDFASLYANFDLPITTLDCGKKCSPYNEYGVPFCCDTSYAIPTAYHLEWDYLRANTDLWHQWEAHDPAETTALQSETPESQTLIECLGHRHCQRNFRSITCRAFPFYPYISREREFLGLSYYWQYEDRCWVINHLDFVSREYVREFVAAYDWILENIPGEFENFRHHSIVMRRVFGRQKRTIPLLHRDGGAFTITPKDGGLQRVDLTRLPKYGPFEIAALMPFPDEL